MPRNHLGKEEMKIRALKLRRDVDAGLIGSNWVEYQKDVARTILNKILDVIDEYRY
jgi:hypothetical protein